MGEKPVFEWIWGLPLCSTGLGVLTSEIAPVAKRPEKALISSQIWVQTRSSESLVLKTQLEEKLSCSRLSRESEAFSRTLANSWTREGGHVQCLWKPPGAHTLHIIFVGARSSENKVETH